MAGQRRCIYCKREGLTREHVFPQWVLRLFESYPDGRLTLYFNFADPNRDSITREWSAPRTEVVVRRVCSSCNNGWMSKLEETARPVVERLIVGIATSLDEAGQAIAASWCAKTAMMLGLALPKQIIPHFYYEQFFEEGEPSRNATIYLSSFLGETVTWFHVHHINLNQPSNPTIFARGYSSSFVIGHLAVTMFAHDFTERFILTPDHVVRLGLLPIWPITYRLRRWPPLQVLSDEGLPAFGRMFMMND